ncbi:MAG TPA: hypothetical protein VET65_13115 [Candidatus Limnocylindrales bacterium]|nr:hypothetical protein [Candidatus Limnocylindrales bacterium]
MLFLELALIRWSGANILYLSYFSNFILLASFLGIGIGFLLAGGRVDAFAWAPLGVLALVAFVLAFPVQIDRSGSELIYFGALESSRSGLPIWATLPVLFLAVAAIMAMVAQGVARAFAGFAPLEAYRLDILGSLLGIAAFTGLSFLGAPPLAWGAVVAALFALLLVRRDLVRAAALVGLLVLLGIESAAALTSWSPYYKVSLQPHPDGATTVLVNGIPHQTIESVARREAVLPIYVVPYREAPAHRDVLIVGAGTGDDVAIALQQGAQRVDAVEIDPRLYQLGRALHPDHPYDDPRVHVVVNDGRAFLQQTSRRYDLILFALPDSLTLVAGQSSLRLESYLFTTGAVAQARAHLKPAGVFAEYNYYREAWLIDRLAGTLAQVYGAPPCVTAVTGVSGDLALIAAGARPDVITCSSPWRASVSPVPAPATDDYPFLYLRDRGIPGFYLLTIGLILLVSVVGVRQAAGGLRRLTPYLDLALMGAAFLLLETKNVVQFALLFGTTWSVNAIVFGGILLAVLAAIEVSRRVRIGTPPWLYGGLLLALALSFLVPPEALLGLPLGPRIVAAVAVAFVPIFIANLLFAQRFAEVSASTVAFGANLLGAMAGGVLEYASLATGYRALLVVVAALYGGAFLAQRMAAGPRATLRAWTAPRG